MFAVNVETSSHVVNVETNKNTSIYLFLLNIDQLVIFLDYPIKFDLEGLQASDCVDQKEQGACASKQTKRTMAVGKSVAEELLNALKQPKLRAMPSYISEDDTVSVDDFMQSRYACDYVLDTSNIHWEEN